MPDRREEIAKKHVPCRCDEAYKSRGLSAPDCPFHSTDPEEAMDEYFTERAIELLEFLGRHKVSCSLSGKKEVRHFYKGEWITSEQLFKNYL